MDKLFLQIINMSLISSCVILFVIVARMFLKKSPKIFSYALWGVVLFRLVCPFSFESMISLIPINKTPIPMNISSSQISVIDSGIEVIDKAVSNNLPPPEVISESVNTMQILIGVGEIIWLIGFAILLVYSLFTVVKLHNKVKNAINIEKNIYEMQSITPFVFGLIKPKIYLPSGLDDNQKAYILKHEQTHIRRLDYIIKPFAFLVLCVHWFNPLVWFAFFLMGEDMELSCDESVIKQLGNSIKKDYSSSLLSLTTGKRIIGGCPLAFGESDTKGRIKNILNYKKPAFWAIAVSLIAVILICIGLISNPKNNEKISFINYSDTYMGNIYEQDNQVFSSDESYAVQIPNEIHKIAPENTAKLEELMQFEKWKESKGVVYDFVSPDVEILDPVKGYYLMYNNVDGKTYFEVFNPNWKSDNSIRRFFAPKEIYKQVKDYIKTLPMEYDDTTTDSVEPPTDDPNDQNSYGSFQSEYTTKSRVEEVVLNWFSDEVKNKKGVQYTNYILHELKIITQDKFVSSYPDSAPKELIETAKKENLIDYSFVYASYTSEYSPELFRRGQQFSDGEGARVFLAGKTKDDKDYKVYDISLPLIVGEDIPPLYAKIISIDVNNNILQVQGTDKNTINQIGDKCNLSCGRGLIVNSSGSRIFTIKDFKVGDKIEFRLFGRVQESYPTSAVSKSVFQLAE